MGGGKGKAPPPPDYSQLATSNIEVAKLGQETAKDQLAWAKEQYGKDAAITERILNTTLPAFERQLDVGLDFQAKSWQNMLTMFERENARADQGLSIQKQITDTQIPLMQQEAARLDDQWNTEKKVTETMLPFMQKSAEQALDLNNRSMAIQEGTYEQTKRVTEAEFQEAQRLRERYRSKFEPMEDQFVSEANSYASSSRMAQELGKSQADVTAAFDQQRAEAAAALEGYGVDPTQTRARALDLSVRAQQAATQAGAANQTRDRVDATGRAMRAEAINLGRGLSANVQGAYQTGLTASGQSAGIGATLGQMGNASGGTAINAGGSAVGASGGGFNRFMGLAGSLSGAYNNAVSNASGLSQSMLGASQGMVNSGFQGGFGSQQSQLALGNAFSQRTQSASSFLGAANQANANYGNLISNIYGTQMQGWAARQNSSSGIGGALGSIMGGVGSLYGSGIFSDTRLKYDIRPVGTAASGVGLFTYRYLGEGKLRFGLMAQDVEKVRPDAVAMVGGYRAVDYSHALAV